MFGLCIIMLSGCHKLMEDYELDTRPDYWDDITLLDYIDQGENPDLTLYAEAVRYAGVENLLEGQAKTRIVPTNEAIQGMLLSAGVSSIQELSPNVVKEMLSYLVIPGAYRSLDLDEGETIGEVTARGDSLYLTRTVTATDKYRLFVNSHAKLATPQIAVNGQDYVFRDGVAHIVNVFPTYQEITTPTDQAPEGVDYSEAKKDTLWVEADAHVYRGARDNNYGGDGPYTTNSIIVNSRPDNHVSARRGFIKFALKEIAFADDLVGASFNFNVRTPFPANITPTLGVWETGTDWEELEVTWNTMPTFGGQIATSEVVTLGWNAVSLTTFINRAYQEHAEAVSLGLGLMDDPNGEFGNVFIYNREQSNGDYKAFISLLGAMPSELELDHLSTLQVPQDGAAAITKEQLSMRPAASPTYNYTDNNIIYVLAETPANGTVTRFGFPIGKFGEFTQEELQNGAVRYVHNGGSSSDVITFKVKDYIGGVYADLIELPVTVQ